MRGQVEGAAVATTGVVLAAVQAVHAITGTQTAVGLVFNAVPFVLMALAIAYVGYRLVVDAEFAAHTDRIAAWTAGGAVAFAAVSALILFSVNVAVDPFPVFASAGHVATDTITAGTLVGVLVGIYDARGEARRVELERGRDRIEAFANRAADTNNYGRALNRCDSVEEISALCVEAVAALAGLHDAAFVERRGEGVTLVDSSIVGLDDTVVADLAGRATDQDPSTVVAHATDLPASLPADVESVVVIRVTELRGATVGIVALNRGAGDLEDETVTLLEMLVSHAATALENVSGADDREGPPGAEIESGDG